MRKLILILMIFQIVIVKNNLCAQTSEIFSLEMHENRDWFIKFVDADHNKRPAQGIKMENNMLISFAYFDGKRKELKAPYYISNTLDKTFVPSKIGKNKSGKYLIINDPSGFMCAKIIAVTKTEMFLHCYWTNTQLSFTTKRPD